MATPAAAASFSEEVVHTEWLNSKGKRSLSLRKGTKRHWEVELDSPGVYVFHAVTKDIAAPGGKNLVRYVQVKLSISFPEREEPMELVDRVNCSRNVSLRFHVPTSAKVNITMSTLAVLKAMVVKAHIGLKPNLTPNLPTILEDSDETEAQLSKLEEKLLDLSKLPSDKRERVQSLVDLWPPEGTSFLEHPTDNFIDQLQRESKFKTKAFNLGLIRPFLLFASMHPVKRLRWAKALKVPVMNSKHFGDAHAEAYMLLTADRKGLQARANHAFADSINPLGNDSNWYQILFRVCRTAIMKDKKVDDDTKDGMTDLKSLRSFAKSIGLCKSKEAKELEELEQFFALGIAQVLQFVVRDTSEEEYDQLQREMQDDSFLPYMEILREQGYTNEELMRFMCWVGTHGGEACLFKWLGKWGKKAQEGTAANKARIALPAFMIGVNAVIALVMSLSPLIVIPISLLAINSAMFVWRETPGKLLVPLMGLTTQRFRLAVRGIRLEDYYPVDPEATE